MGLQTHDGAPTSSTAARPASRALPTASSTHDHRAGRPTLAEYLRSGYPAASGVWWYAQPRVRSGTISARPDALTRTTRREAQRLPCYTFSGMTKLGRLGDRMATTTPSSGRPAIPATPARLAARLSKLLKARRRWQAKRCALVITRSRLSNAWRKTIYARTAGLCHICGGRLTSDWCADHVRAHRRGGTHRLENYLPEHPHCNNCRWDYSPQEFQWIMELGIWARDQIEKSLPLASDILTAFHRSLRGKQTRRQRRGKRRPNNALQRTGSAGR